MPVIMSFFPKNKFGLAVRDLIFFCALSEKKHLEGASDSHFAKNSLSYIIIPFSILNYFERFFRNKKY
jgi:hypothetical protein